jgi:hypothetical protein
MSTQALDWLYERYWLPSIQSADAQQSLAHEHLTSELVTLFRTYKAARKAAVRDATLLDPAAQDKLLMAIEKLAAGLRMQYGVAEGLEAVAEQLVAPGGLVPKGKRCARSVRVVVLMLSHGQETHVGGGNGDERAEGARRHLDTPAGPPRRRL